MKAGAVTTPLLANVGSRPTAVGVATGRAGVVKKIGPS